MSARDGKLAELREIAKALGHPYNGVCDPHTVAKALLLIGELIEKYAWRDPAETDRILRCEHGSALSDVSGEALEPPCGCRLVGTAIIVPLSAQR